MYIEHVNLTVSDLDRSVDFYCQLLDLRLRWAGQIDVHQRGAHVGDDRNYLALFEATVPDRVVSDSTRSGYNHVGWVVDDLDEARRRLERLGISAHHEAEYEPGRRLYFYDPDGHEVELVEL